VQSYELLRARLAGVSAYRNLLSLPVLTHLERTLTALRNGDGETAVTEYCDSYYALSRAGADTLSAYLEEHLRYDTAPFPEQAAAHQVSPALEEAAQRDVDTLAQLCRITPEVW
jgi:hypothetical protein